MGTRALAPDLEVIAPARMWGLTREDCIEYAAKWDIPLSVTKEKLYSIDENLWGKAIECGVIEDPWNQPPEDVYTHDPADGHRADRDRDRVRGRACPVSVDGRPLRARAADRRDEPRSSAPTASGASTWWRTAGSASRAGRPTNARRRWPCSWPTPTSRTSPSSATSTTRRPDWSPGGRSWSTTGCGSRPLKQALDAFFLESQRHVTGEVRLRLDAGQCWVVGRRSPVSLYDYGLATYDAADTFRHEDAEGFVRLWGLGVATWSAVQEGRRRGAGGPGR